MPAPASDSGCISEPKLPRAIIGTNWPINAHPCVTLHFLSAKKTGLEIKTSPCAGFDITVKCIKPWMDLPTKPARFVCIGYLWRRNPSFDAVKLTRHNRKIERHAKMTALVTVWGGINYCSWTLIKARLARERRGHPFRTLTAEIQSPCIWLCIIWQLMN